MWQPDDDSAPARGHLPDSWAVIRKRLDHSLIGAYCAMRFDGHSPERALRDCGLSPDDLETAIRRGAEVYGHELDDALRRAGLTPSHPPTAAA